MTAPLPSRDAIEKAAKWFRLGRMPPRHEADRIAQALDAMALGMALGNVYERNADREQPNTHFHRQEA